MKCFRKLGWLVVLSLLFVAQGSNAATQLRSASYDPDEPVIEDNTGVSEEVADPLETLNRGIYKFNDVLYKFILKPIVKTYRFVVPEIGRKRIHSVLKNLSEPVTFLNSILQGDVQNTFTTFWRFTLNSTFGIGGLFDVADKYGLKPRTEDFGQTLGVYGMSEGFYFVVPVLGPSSGRDVVGKVADIFSDPLLYLAEDDVLYAKTGVSGVDEFDGILDLKDEIDRTSLDPYATVRSLYTQKRRDEVKNGGKAE